MRRDRDRDDKDSKKKNKKQNSEQLDFSYKGKAVYSSVGV
jgi:hypothetical protein